MCNLSWTPHSNLEKDNSLKNTPVLAQRWAVWSSVVPVMNGHPRDQAKVSVHCRWPLIRGTDGHVEMSRDIDNVAVHSRWPLTTGVAQGRYYCILTKKMHAETISVIL